MTGEKRRDLSTSQPEAPEEVREEDSRAATERIERMQQEGKGVGGTSTQGRTHPERDESNRERKEREMRDREELGRPPGEARERALAEDVTERRDREASERADRIADRGTDVVNSEPEGPPHTDAA